ncbi:MAG: hypothetical protein J7521_03885 [Caulobacter sp.]|nr:hypothetical protein [Caulobacter sp.]
MSKHRSIKILAAMSVAITIVSCYQNLDPGAIELGAVVDNRPPLTIGPGRKGLWRSISVSLDRQDILAIRKMGSTVQVEFDDCAGGHVSIDELYVDDISLNVLRFMPRSEFIAFYKGLNGSIHAKTYISEEAFSSRPELCFSMSGGTMSGGRLASSKFVLKRHGVPVLPRT